MLHHNNKGFASFLCQTHVAGRDSALQHPQLTVAMPAEQYTGAHRVYSSAVMSGLKATILSAAWPTGFLTTIYTSSPVPAGMPAAALPSLTLSTPSIQLLLGRTCPFCFQSQPKQLPAQTVLPL
jgi:hypothetical protein